MNNNYFNHLSKILKHKWYVFIACCHYGIPLKGLVHDLSKFSPIEFLTTAKYYQGNGSPIDAVKKEKGFSLAWQHHKGRNPHHWEYWIDNLSDYKNTPCRIPEKYVVEMVCDWIGAGKAYEGKSWTKESPCIYFDNGKHSLLHPETKEMIDYMLTEIYVNGVKYAGKVWRRAFKKAFYADNLK